jgi:hypothetical protein
MSDNVYPIRPSITTQHVDRDLQKKIIRELQRDVDAVAKEARDRGRVEGFILTAAFVLTGLTAASLVTF